MSLASWAFFRQIEALRVATGTALQFGAIAKGKRTVSDAEIHEWLAAQGMEASTNLVPFVLTALSLKQLQHPRAAEILQRSQAGQSETDFGRSRSGADFHDQTDFVITSGFVRILGAHEQFERDVLKALLYYRPAGRSGPANEHLGEEVGEEVLLEQPIRHGDTFEYNKPAVWTWLSRVVENNIERRKVFRKVFDIATLPSPTAHKVHDLYYDKRNAIVHGREGVHMTLSEYQIAETHLIEAALHLTEACEQKYRLRV